VASDSNGQSCHHLTLRRLATSKSVEPFRNRHWKQRFWPAGLKAIKRSRACSSLAQIITLLLRSCSRFNPRPLDSAKSHDVRRITGVEDASSRSVTMSAVGHLALLLRARRCAEANLHSLTTGAIRIGSERRYAQSLCVFNARKHMSIKVRSTTEISYTPHSYSYA
jgi:hypothetical protein